MKQIESNRDFMKSNFGLAHRMVSDQSKGVPPPPLQKPYDKSAQVVDLPKPDAALLSQQDMYACLKQRRSRRQFSRKELSLHEVAFLLWSTQGIQEVAPGGYASFRPAPSAGARHPFETYLVVNRVTGLAKGVYRYLPLEHQLVFEFDEAGIPRKLSRAALGQDFVGEGAAVFVWSCIPYRGEWRYTILAHKVMLIDVGHVCQNLYLACEAMGCATCGVGAYDQEAIDRFLKLDGQDEFVVYLAPVGKK